MIKEIGGEWFICHVRFGPNLDEPFPTKEAAQVIFDAMSPVDQMLATGRTPYLRTDAEFLKESENGRQFQDTPKLGDLYKERCEAAGGSVVGKKYLHQLAKFPGDPDAWVSSRGDVERAAKKKGCGVEGLVNVPTPEVEPPKRVKVAKDIVDREVKKALRGTKGMPKKLKSELREAIEDKIAPK